MTTVKKQRKESTFFTFMEGIIRRLEHHRQIGTAKNYRATLNCFQLFRDNIDLYLKNIDKKLIEDFQAYMRVKGLTPNSISFYMRIMRAVYNRATDEELTIDRKPFRSVFTGIEKTRKRAITSEEISHIKNLDLTPYPNLEFARDIFIFLFFCRGMSFIDAAFLRKTDIKNGTIIYRRHKTGQQLSIKIMTQIHNLLVKYATSPDSPFLLPVIICPGENERRQYESALRRVNNALKKVGEMAGLSTNLTTYVCRHSWATIAKSMNIPVNVISDALGHESVVTTQIYLGAIDTSAIDLANEQIITGL